MNIAQPWPSLAWSDCIGWIGGEGTERVFLNVRKAKNPATAARPNINAGWSREIGGALGQLLGGLTLQTFGIIVDVVRKSPDKTGEHRAFASQIVGCKPQGPG
jgi:hypothetical protein